MPASVPGPGGAVGPPAARQCRRRVASRRLPHRVVHPLVTVRAAVGTRLPAVRHLGPASLLYSVRVERRVIRLYHYTVAARSCRYRYACGMLVCTARARGAPNVPSDRHAPSRARSGQRPTRLPHDCSPRSHSAQPTALASSRLGAGVRGRVGRRTAPKTKDPETMRTLDRTRHP